MWVYFNSRGQLIDNVEFGDETDRQPSVGTTDFKIFAVFEKVDISPEEPNDEIVYNYANIKLIKPDLNHTEYPILPMERKRLTYTGNDSFRFRNGENYDGYYFDFGEFVDGQEITSLLDIPGQWEALITLIGNNRRLNVQGMATFTVQQGVFQESYDIETEITVDMLLNKIYGALAVFNPKTTATKNWVIEQIPTFAIVQDALTNINGRYLSNFSAVSAQIEASGVNYDTYSILKNNDSLTEEQARDYMEYMTGYRFLPVYNFEKPRNSFLMFADGTLWKPQYSEQSGLILFKVTNPFVTQAQLNEE